jgi:creatinine amidohydrolase/Fe(II)-dependent formamide hydrolase-like protein
VIPFDVPEGTTEEQAEGIAETIMEKYGRNRDIIVAPPMMFGGGDPQPVLKHLYCLSREAYRD